MLDTLSYEKIHAFASSWFGGLIILAAIALPIYHAMHRIFHGLHDLGIHPTKFLHVLLYGFAFLLPSLILVTGILSPLGVLDTLSYEKIHAFASSWFGGLIILAAKLLFLWCYLSLQSFQRLYL